MKNTYLLICFLILSVSTVFAQDNSALFTVAGEKVTAKEFKRVYSKNLELVKDEAQKDVDNYLELFVNYKLKLKQAYDEKLNEKPSYIRELKNYRKELAKNYLTDNKVTEALVNEAYNRVTNEVKAKHILVRIAEDDTDTTEVYNQINSYRKRFLNEDFEKLQSELHNGSTVFVEDLGYFSGFKMVYDFENVAFNTNAGEVSKPFRTRFGYHVVKVYDKRPSRGEVTVAHIMIKKKKDVKNDDLEKRINDIYKKLQNGETFEALAKQFSEDQSSAKKGGLLKSFKSGQLTSVTFEDKAFSLKEGEVSKPFETKYGWHISKLISKKGNPTFEEIKPELQNRVRRDSRSKLIDNALTSKLKKRYNVSSVKPDLTYFINALDSTYYKRKWEVPTNIPNTTLVKIDKKDITYSDFINHLATNQKKNRSRLPFDKIVNKQYDVFFEKAIRDYQEENLENENPEFAEVVQEYRDGLLLFDLMETKIWNAAKQDTVGLERFYNDNKTNYMWKDRIEATVYTASKNKDIKAVKKLLEKGTASETIEKTINVNNEPHVILTSETMTREHRLLPKDFNFKKGVSEIFEHNNAFHIVKVNEVLPSKPKTLEEAKGFIITDYQNYLEKQWLKELHDKYKVKIDQDVLKRVKADLGR